MSLQRVTILVALSTFALFALLIVSLLSCYRGELFLATLMTERTLFSIRLSVYSATVAAVLATTLAVPSAYALSRCDFWGKNAVDTMLELPMIVSPAALGAMLLIFFSTPLGTWIQDRGISFVFDSNGIILAQFVTTLGVATRLTKAAMDEIPRRYEDVARTLGASPLAAFYTVTLPLCRRGLAAAFILSWAKALGEFGATITLAGTMAMKTETLPIAIFMKLSTADIDGTVVLILIVTTIGIGTLYLARLIGRKGLHA
jgi:molybdate transport system permease protein